MRDRAYVADYLPFDQPVPFVRNGRYAEAALREVGDPHRVGAYLQGKSIRALQEEDFADAYNNTCAITRLNIVNGFGRPEAQAAHIWPVADGGPDVVQNGLALSSTVHWLFDRQLISLTSHYRILVSHNKVPSELRSLFAKQMDRIHLPVDKRHWPHAAYIGKHRERLAAG